MRRKIMLLHLIIAALITPAVLLVSISGGLYLIGIKGSINSTEVNLASDAQLDFDSKDLENDVRKLIKDSGLDYQFEYLKVRDDLIQTRPTSRNYIELRKIELRKIELQKTELQQNDSLSMAIKSPDLQKSLIELHKGHGPQLFKLYQKACAIGLILVLLSGVFMGLINPNLRTKAIASLIIGFGIFITFAFF